MTTTVTSCRQILWKGRRGYRLANDCVELTTLIEGGAIAEWRFLPGLGKPHENVLWEAPWPTMDPAKYQTRRHARRYGPQFVGRFLAGFTGHVLCLDFFGAPSEEEIQAGLSLHGEACVSRWRGSKPVASGQQVKLRLAAQLPAAGLKFERELSLLKGESVAYVREVVCNQRKADHFFHWTQHVTFGPPFLHPVESMIAMSASQGISWPLGYEGKSLLANSRSLRWPEAPAEGGGMVDLARPFTKDGTGFVAALLTDSNRAVAFLAVLNRRLGLVAGYCFPRSMFPWITVWEENRARGGPPWDGRTQARGLEFGTTPMPLGREATFRNGSLLDTPAFCRVPASGTLQVGYVSFLAAVGRGWNEIRDIEIGEKAITIVGDSSRRVEVAAHRLQDVVMQGLGPNRRQRTS